MRYLLCLLILPSLASAFPAPKNTEPPNHLFVWTLVYIEDEWPEKNGISINGWWVIQPCEYSPLTKDHYSLKLIAPVETVGKSHYLDIWLPMKDVEKAAIRQWRREKP